MAEGKTPKRSRSARSRAVQLPAHLDITSVGELKQTLSASRPTAAGELVLDASAVEHVDFAGMQLLFAFRQSAHQQDCKIRWENPPDRLKNAAVLLGMNESFNFDM